MGWTRGKRNSVKWSQRNFVCVFSAALAAPLSLWTVAFLFWGDEDVAPTAVAEPALVLVSWRPGVLSNRRLMQLHWRAVGSLARQGLSVPEADHSSVFRIKRLRIRDCLSKLCKSPFNLRQAILHVLQPAINRHTLNQNLLQPACRPPAEQSSLQRLNPIPDRDDDIQIIETGYAVDATYTTSCAPPPMMEDLGLGSVAIARPASL